MIATILAITILNSDGSVQYQSPQPRVENHYHYNTYSSQPDYREQQQRMLDRYNADSQRMLNQSNDYYFQQELLRSLRGD